EPGIQRGRQPGLRARKEDLDRPAALVWVPRPTWVVDGGGHLFAPGEILAKAIDHALRDGDPPGGGLALETLLLWALDVGLDVVSHRRHRSEGLLAADGLSLVALGLFRKQRRLSLLGRDGGEHSRERSGGPVRPVVLDTIRFGRGRHSGPAAKLWIRVVADL